MLVAFCRDGQLNWATFRMPRLGDRWTDLFCGTEFITPEDNERRVTEKNRGHPGRRPSGGLAARSTF